MNLNYSNGLSEYELIYLIWYDIGYDRKKLIKFIKKLKLLKFLSFFSTKHRKEKKIMVKILNNQNQDKIKKLLLNDENTVRNGIIEKYARRGAIEILTNSRLSFKTYEKIINLPLADYKLILKRIEELIRISQNIAIQSDSMSNQIPGA